MNCGCFFSTVKIKTVSKDSNGLCPFVFVVSAVFVECGAHEGFVAKHMSAKSAVINENFLVFVTRTKQRKVLK